MSSASKKEEDSGAVSLMRAASSGDLSAVNARLAEGADVNSANQSGQTALILAAVMGHAEVVASLIEAGADPDLRDRVGLTALEWSTRRGFSEVSQLLTKISPPLPRPSHTPTTSAQPSEETRSDPATSTEIGATVSQVSEAVPVDSSTSSNEQIKTEQEELPTATTTEESRPLENLPEPVAVTTESLAPTSAAVEFDSQPQQLTSASEPTKAESSSEASSAVASVEIESKASELGEAVPASSSASSEGQIKTERGELPTAASVEQPWWPETSLETAKPVLADEEIAATATIRDDAGIRADQQSTKQASVDITSSPEGPAEPPTLPSDSASKPEEKVAVEYKPAIYSKSGSTSGSTPPPAELQPEPQVNHLVTNVAAADSQDTKLGAPSKSSSKDPNLEKDEEETLTRPPVPESPRIPTPRPFTSPVSSTPAATSTPLERMPWMADREPAFKTSPLSLSTKQSNDDSRSVSNLKRCQKCNTVYQNTLFSYCPRDNAPLLGINELQPAAVANPSTPVAVWLLIAFVLGASAFAAYRLTQYLYRAEEPAPAASATTPDEVPAEAKKPFFTVGGRLAGTEVNVPEPDYPSELRSAGVGGPITVTIRVNKSGRVISAVSSGGDRRLRSAAVTAARQATFAADKLAEANPRSRVVSGTITYEFAPPQTDATTSPAPTSTETPSATNTINADPNAPVISDTLAGAALNVPAAEYPSRTRRAGVGGAITVTIRVNRAGKVISWRSSAGDAQLRAAAIKAARRATFSPDKLQGSGEVLGTITYNFTP